MFEEGERGDWYSSYSILDGKYSLGREREGDMAVMVLRKGEGGGHGSHGHTS